MIHREGGGILRSLLITIAFDGRGYHGYQVQENALTVAEVFQDAVERVFGSRLPVKGCSRTDSGVHAAMFCISLQTESRIPAPSVVKALNCALPKDIAAKDCREVPEGFHARYDCKGKEYLYRLHNGAVRDPFLRGLAYEYPYPVDVPLLHQEGQSFIGTHDFSSFCSAHSSVKDTVRTVFDVSVTRDGDIIEFKVAGNGFLYNMVRIMVGTLLDIGRGAIPGGSIPQILESHDRSRAGITAPAEGLYLNRVFYSWDNIPQAAGSNPG